MRADEEQQQQGRPRHQPDNCTSRCNGPGIKKPISTRKKHSSIPGRLFRIQGWGSHQNTDLAVVAHIPELWEAWQIRAMVETQARVEGAAVNLCDMARTSAGVRRTTLSLGEVCAPPVLVARMSAKIAMVIN